MAICIGLAVAAAPFAAMGQGYMNQPPVLGPNDRGGTQEPSGTVEPESAPGVVAPAEGQPPPPPAWIVVPRIGVAETVTDNARATSVARQADLVTTLAPGIAVTADTARLKGSLDYELDVQRYLKATDQNRIANNLFSTGEATIVPNLLFFDGRASISQVDVAGGRGFTSSNLIPEAQRAQVIAYTVGPSLRTNIGSS